MKKFIENEKKVTDKQINTIVSNETTSKSAKMKELFDLGIDVKTIANIMNVRYNFVYNVISNYANMNDIQLVTVEKTGKKEMIIDLFLQGRTNKEIAIELKTNYNYVHNVLKKYKEEHGINVQTESK